MTLPLLPLLPLLPRSLVATSGFNSSNNLRGQAVAHRHQQLVQPRLQLLQLVQPRQAKRFNVLTCVAPTACNCLEAAGMAGGRDASANNF